MARFELWGTMRRLLWIALAVAFAAAALADDDEAAQITQRIGEKFHAAHEQSGAPIRGMLEASGLAVEDSDRIAKAFIDGIVSCVLDAARMQAEERSITYREVLLDFEQELDDPEVDTPALIDEAAGDQAAETCVMREMQQAGVSMELAIQYATQSSTDPR